MESTLTILCIESLSTCSHARLQAAWGSTLLHDVFSDYLQWFVNLSAFDRLVAFVRD